MRTLRASTPSARSSRRCTASAQSWTYPPIDRSPASADRCHHRLAGRNGLILGALAIHQSINKTRCPSRRSTRWSKTRNRSTVQPTASTTSKNQTSTGPAPTKRTGLRRRLARGLRRRPAGRSRTGCDRSRRRLGRHQPRRMRSLRRGGTDGFGRHHPILRHHIARWSPTNILRIPGGSGREPRGMNSAHQDTKTAAYLLK